MKLHIKYMVSARCKMTVKEELKKLGLHFIILDLGEVEVMEDLTVDERKTLKTALLRSGLELMEDKRAVLMEQIKYTIREGIDDSDGIGKTSITEYVSSKLDCDYSYLSRLFSEVQGTTIEQFIISHKVARIKEMLLHGALSISEISFKMNYSSVAHLSNQFKKVTGLTPAHFKQLKNESRRLVEDVVH